MSNIKRRKELSSSKIRELIEYVKSNYGAKSGYLFETANKIERWEIKRGSAIALDGIILFIEKNGIIVPTVKLAQDKQEHLDLPEVVVDMGAVPYVCRGARIMRPGIVELPKPETKKGQIVQIRDEKNHVVIAIGRLEMNGVDIQQVNKGPVIENITWVGDIYWQLSL